MSLQSIQSSLLKGAAQSLASKATNLQRFASGQDHQNRPNGPSLNFNPAASVALAAGAMYYLNKDEPKRKEFPSERSRHGDCVPEEGDTEFEVEPLSFEEVQTIRIEGGITDAIGGYQKNANQVIEDRLVAHRIKMNDGTSTTFAAVIDGHSGPQVADYVQRALPQYIQIFVTKNGLNSSDTEKLSKMIPEAFLALDRDMCKIMRHRTDFHFTRTGKIGACCLGVLVTPTKAIVANAGDCEGIVGFNTKEFVPLAEPHSANLPTEQARLKREHPGESNIIRCKRSQEIPRVPARLHEYLLNAFGILGTKSVPDVCYVKGRLQPTRCFGDFHLKAKEFAYDHEAGRALVQPPFSFPYITSYPDVYTIDLKQRRKNGLCRRAKYITLCCDGVYDFMTHKQVHHQVETQYRSGNSPDEIAKGLVDATFEYAALDNNKTLNGILNLATDQKRRHHDDTSVLHLDLDLLRKL